MYRKFYDVVGVGFGPAGIALETAIRDMEDINNKSVYKRVFLEKNNDSAWMPEMLLPGTDIQHHFLRDFATPRNPRSQYTFSNYLYEKGRLFSFGLLGRPSRTEWSDYVQWVSKQIDDKAHYNEEVKSVKPIVVNDDIEGLEVHTVNNVSKEHNVFHTTNLILNSGRKPYIPSQFKDKVSDKVFHASKFRSSVQSINKDDNPTFTVIGSGQNSVEIILYLANKFPKSKINSIVRHTGFRLYELGHFTNEVFFPEFTNYFYSLNQNERDKLFEQIKHTNYSAVDDDVSEALYWKMYEDKIRGTEQIELHRCKEIVDVANTQKDYLLNIKDIYNKQEDSINTDYIILCTGFFEEEFPEVLQPMKKYFNYNKNNSLKVSENYKVDTKSNVKANIYLNGLTEKTHGIGDAASFTMMATKAQRILDSMNNITSMKDGVLS
ncbi:SidA/IucD/PvdA family monooxygenase [Agaribacter marinus]|uniref:L-lysine N6-monooxygenase MbtG n=1 Tax=Virgibacillus salarius TaxID=447199 RepID=A0A941E133_9BACI|nr:MULTISPECIES: SidA/IucD/PvdA family monooxygenase [Virgibacillus]MBR7796973.1 SidA/IucD/PvdA family monooxygenase [Virgibacillus salarius]MDY7046497.1 SidA/IucD/PvdA family monooxygenase [Virgibacillus sp. M23]NAZ09683.1 SidA/IucD/PvdA family monooxygenase [Agaribacter marinus]